MSARTLHSSPRHVGCSERPSSEARSESELEEELEADTQDAPPRGGSGSAESNSRGGSKVEGLSRTCTGLEDLGGICWDDAHEFGSLTLATFTFDAVWELKFYLTLWFRLSMTQL